MDCEKVREKIYEYNEGGLTETERAEIERHCDGCIQCAEALSEARRTLELLASVPKSVPLPSGALQRAIDAAQSRRLAEKRAKSRRFMRIASSIAAALVLTLGIYAITNHNMSAAPQPSSQKTMAYSATSGEADTVSEKMADAAAGAPEANDSQTQSMGVVPECAPAESEAPKEMTEPPALYITEKEPIEIYLPGALIDEMTDILVNNDDYFTLNITDDNIESVSRLFADYELEFTFAAGDILNIYPEL